MKRKQYSIKNRLTLTSVAGFLIIGLLLACFIIHFFTQYMRDETFENAPKVLRGFEYDLIQKNQETLLKQVKILAGSPQIAEWINQKNTKMLDQAFRPFLESGTVDFLWVRDQRLQFLEANRRSMEIAKLLDITPGKGSLDFKDAHAWVVQNQSRDLLIIASAPVRNSARAIVGDVIAGSYLIESGYVDRIKANYDLEAAIFSANIGIDTTFSSQNGEKPLNPRLDPKIARIVLGQGKNFAGEATLLGQPYFAFCRPIMGTGGQPLGALFVGKPLKEFLTERNQLAFVILLFIGIIILLGIMHAEFWHHRVIVKPITGISKALQRFTEEDWTIAADTSAEKKPDEIGELSVSFSKLVHAVRGYRDRVKQIAYYDDLTGLPNRACLYEKYKSGLNSGLPGSKSVLIYLDTDDLKLVNDVYGHRLGDQLLKSISIRIAALAGPRGFDTFRLWGDEFILFQNNCSDLREVPELAQAILNGFQEPFQTGGNTFRVSLSMGISVSGDAGTDLAQLLKNAEIAMCQVKEKGKNGFIFFDPSMDRILKYRVELEQDIRNALLHQEFQLYYQPKVEVETGRYEGFEALLRWEHPKKGWISPEVFINLAEQTGLIVPIGEWVLKTACRFLKELNKRMNSNYQISVNVSVIQLLHADFKVQFEKILNETGLAPQLLELEITESLLMESPEIVFDQLLSLRDQGISIALDDFGKGYSSLTYLRHLPISTLKIDPSFVADIGDKDQSYLIGDIIRLGHHMGLRVVAEGIETKTQLEYLRKHRCDLIQGYYFCQPLPKAELISRLENNTAGASHLAI